MNTKKRMLPVSLLLAACLLGACPAAFAQTDYLEEVKVENRSVEKEGRTVRVSFDVNMDALDMKSQHSLRLVPTLVSADGTEEFALSPLVVNGKVRDRVQTRQRVLGNRMEEEGVPVVRRYNGTAQTVHYESSTPFHRWMVDGRLELRGNVTGCAECGEGGGTVATGDVLPYQEPHYMLPPVAQPKEEVVKRRDVMRVARLQFRQDSYKIDPKFKNNQAELDTVTHSIAVVKDDPDLTITGIYITGYASPEGSMPYNKRLSQNRADALAAYARKDTHVDASLWHVLGMGEDWEGLRAEVRKHPKLLKIEEVLKIVDGCEGDQDACEKQIKALMPPEIYQRMLNEMYGPLRRNEYRIEYNVRHFDLEEARALLKTRPELLSVAEIQKVADSYGRNSDGYREALQVAVRTYPDNVTALNNAALAEVETGHSAAAVTLLKDTEEPSLLNLLGVACAKEGRNEEAKAAFRRAAAAGNADAATNLERLVAAEELLAE